MTEETETTCTACMTIPISHLALEAGVDVPIGGWGRLFADLDIKIVTDPAGRPAIVVPAARKLLASLRRRDQLFAEDAQRRSEKLAARYPVPVGAGLPMVEGATPFESMVVAVGVTTPEQEFAGRPKPNFLAEEIAAGERDLAEKKAANAAKRLVDSARDKLGGKT